MSDDSTTMLRELVAKLLAKNAALEIRIEALERSAFLNQNHESRIRMLESNAFPIPSKGIFDR